VHIALLFAFAGVLLTVDGLGVVLAANAVETNPDETFLTHVAGKSPGSYARRVALFQDNISRFVHNQLLRNLVDKRKGY